MKTMYRKQRPSVALACVIVTVCLSTWAINEAFGKPTTTDENLSTTSQDDSLPPDTFRKLAQALYQRGEKAENRLQRKFFYNDTVMCNDRSTAGYYIRRNFKSKKWIIFLEGGWICHDKKSCMSRAASEHHRVSSERWPSVRTVGGLLSADPAENPYFAEANHVFVPYCSSDAWSGTRRYSRNGGPIFMGGYIVQEVIRELANFENLVYADELYLAGGSAGGTGVLLNVDVVAGMLSETAVKVRGIIDSAWFIDNLPKKADDEECKANGKDCSVIDNLKKGLRLWDAAVPEECGRVFQDEPWKCFLGYQVYKFIKTPLFVFQWQFDKFQLYADKVTVAVSPEGSADQWNYIHGMGASLRSTFENIGDRLTVFSPACIAHEVFTFSHWTDISVQGVTLPDALSCWAESLDDVKQKVVGKRPKINEGFLENYQGVLPRDSMGYSTFDLDSRTMLADSPHSYKTASNLVRSMSSSSSSQSSSSNGRRNSHSHYRHLHHDDSDNARNSIGSSHYPKKMRRRPHLRSGNTGGRNRHRRRNQRKRHQQQQRRRNNNNFSNDEDNRTTALRPLRPLCRDDDTECKEMEAARQAEGGGFMVKSLEGGAGQMEKANKKTKRQRRREERRRERKRLKKQRRKERKRLRRLEKRRLRQLAKQKEKQRKEKMEEENHNHKLKVRSAGGKSSQCQVKYVDSCSWPHCNPTCPKLKNPETGMEIDFLTLLKSFGLDMGSLAKGLGVDMQTLIKMDRDILLHLLTSQQQQHN